jgi:hypothetical protein
VGFSGHLSEPRPAVARPISARFLCLSAPFLRRNRTTAILVRMLKAQYFNGLENARRGWGLKESRSGGVNRDRTFGSVCVLDNYTAVYRKGCTLPTRPAGTTAATTRRPRASDLVRAFAQLRRDEWQVLAPSKLPLVGEARSFPARRMPSAGLTLPWACARESAPTWICVCARGHSSCCRSGCSAPRLCRPSRFDAGPP